MRVRPADAGNPMLALENLDAPSVRFDRITFLLGANKGDEFLVDQIRSFPLRDMPCIGDSDEPRSLHGLMKFLAYSDWEHAIFFPPQHQRRVGDFIKVHG